MISTLQQIPWLRFLGRPQLEGPTPAALETLARERILITGAGGSIGTAVAQRLAAIHPVELVLLEGSESQLFALAAEVPPSPSIAYFLGSTADAALLQHIFAAHRPGIVFHAAAFKQVPLMEQHPFAAIANNIFSTESLARMAQAHRTRMVLLSTDKAVAPASIMGATKRVAEQLVLAAGGTILRLGNVLASRDSVAEIFARQIAAGGPITVTDPAARRYFLTLDEAAGLLLIAAAGNRPALLAPNLAGAHFIADLANFMAHTLSPERELAVEFTHPRAGDKESERLWGANEQARPTDCEGCPLLSIESDLTPARQFAGALDDLHAAHAARDLSAALHCLQLMVPDYTPGAEVRALAARPSAKVSQ